MNTILLVLIGMFIGWNMPQPGYAKFIQEYVVSKLRGFVGKTPEE